MFKFDHVESQERVTADLAPGLAKFKIVGVYTKSKGGEPLRDSDGNPKLNISLSVRDSAGNSGFVYDILTKKTGWKVKAILEALGLEKLYDKSGQLDPNDILNGDGKCMLKLQPTSGAYAARMVVDKYIKSENQFELSSRQPSVPDDDLPF